MSVSDAVRIRRKDRESGNRRTAAIFCLAVFLGSLPWLRLAVLLLMASFDGEHTPLVAMKNGGFDLVLHHEQSVESPGTIGLRKHVHTHGRAAQIMVSMDRDPLGHADHVIHLISGSDAKAGSIRILPGVPESWGVPLPQTLCEVGTFPRPVFSFESPRPPPPVLPFLRHHRLTVLLI